MIKGVIMDSFGTHEIGTGLEGRVRFLLRAFNNHPLFETVVKSILNEFRMRGIKDDV